MPLHRNLTAGMTLMVDPIITHFIHFLPEAQFEKLEMTHHFLPTLEAAAGWQCQGAPS